MTQRLETLELTQERSIATVWLNRPDVHNAFNETLIRELTSTIQQLDSDISVRVIVLAGRGKSFCAGADLGWMRAAAAYTEAQNHADAQRLAQLFKTIYCSSKPIIARVHGPAVGGGTGLAAAADITIASDGAHFVLSEVRLGLIPGTIGPYVAEAIGVRQARRYFLTAERMSADTARQLNLVHEVVPTHQLDERIQTIAFELIKGGPNALATTKSLLRLVTENNPCQDEVVSTTAEWIAMTRVGGEAREGMAAFFAKRAPDWYQES